MSWMKKGGDLGETTEVGGREENWLRAHIKKSRNWILEHGNSIRHLN